MTYFYLLSALLIGLSSLFVIVPLLIKARRNRLEVTNANVVKQRMSELEQEVDEGLISQNDKDSAVRDLKLALVDETDSPKRADTQGVTHVKWSVVSLLSFPAIALGIWVYVDANQLDGLHEYIVAQAQAADLTERIQGQAGAQVTPDDYAKFALVIRKRLRAEPEDAEGWRLLGQVNMAIGRMEESIAAFEKAVALEPQNLALRERYAQALMATGTEDSLANARRQVDYLTRVAPDNRNYRLLLTVVSVQMGDRQAALENFLIIRQQLSPSSEFYQALVEQLLSIGVPESLVRSPMSQDNANASLDMELTGIEIEISVAQELIEKVPQDGFLIVFAQNALSDARVPLAVKRLPLDEFPKTVVLSDDDAMMASMTLSKVTQVRVTARISSDADVMPANGELQGQIDSLQLNKDALVQSELVINEEL